MKKRWLRAALVAVTAMLLALACCVATAGAVTPKEDVALTVTGKDGTVKTFTMTELRALTTAEQGYFEGYAGFVNSAGTVTPVHPVQGIKLTSLLAQVGYDPAATDATDVWVQAIDDYPAYQLSPSFVQGRGILTYLETAPSTPVALPAGTTLTAVLGFGYKQPGQEVGDSNPWLPEIAAPMGEGPLRLWFATEARTIPGYIVDGDWCIKWVNRVRVMGSTQVQWTLTLSRAKTPWRTAKSAEVTRKDFATCVSASCHGQTTVRAGGHQYQGLPLYYLAGKVDDNKSHESFGSFNVRLATKGYWIDVRNKTRKVTINSKLIAGKSRSVIVAWKKDGKYLGGENAPLQLVSTKLTASQRIAGIKSITLRAVPR